MPLHAGIDEAGLGPLLGPLCFGFTAFDLPPGLDLWDAFDPLVTRRPGPGLAVADSKRLYPGPGGFSRLEESVLAFVTAWHGEFPETIREFLRRSPLPVGDEILARHPWYATLDEALPRRAQRGKIEDFAGQLRERMRACDIALLAAASRPVPEGELNESFRATGNKSSTHFEKCAEAISWIVAHCGDRGGTLWIDRHGMRKRYASLLASVFPGRSLWTVQEEKGRSSYRLEGREQPLQIVFAEKAEDRAFAVALASLLAKYTREIFMERWNGFFSRVAPGVRPTAGYYTDARRFLREAGPQIDRARLPLEILIRER